ncbi:Ubiquitin carboxyl-terminal hydrolase 27 [Symbiodinium microadriaticum]|uniref:ubiquitinyl hydrolase 1 n=1 Tax=Symbiodinium microadriaticum TaxID=2951 RepID=A0A1Q9DVL3_SYMMI|nr:Ubiquitin carboxyl-terminal hydrolase 27 [Symbiodinium microadriaticum]
MWNRSIIVIARTALAMAGGLALDEDGAAVLRGEIRRILGLQTPEELLRGLTGKELQEMLSEAHVTAKAGQANVVLAAFQPPPRPLGEIEAAPKGLANLGNTCYLGSILQCLAQTQTFTSELADHEGRLGRIGHELNSVLAQLRDMGHDQPSVAAILGELAGRYSWYQGKSQQDAHELLRTLLGALADELEAPEDQQSLQQVVQRSFRGQICEAILCWSCRRISLRCEEFLDLSLDIAAGDDDPGPLGLHGWIMKPLPQEEHGDETDLQAAGEKEAEPESVADEFEQSVLEVQLERVPGRRIALGLDWAETQQHGCKVLRRVLHGSMVDTWNKRQSEERRLSPGLLLLSVNGKEDQDDMMQALKDDQRLLLRFASAEAVAARKSAPDAQGFRVELARHSKASWGLQLERNGLEDGLIIVAQVVPDSILDAWNLRCQSTGRHKAVVHAGDRVLKVNDSDNADEMSKSLTDLSKRKIVLHLERGKAKKPGVPEADIPADQAEDPDAIFLIELQPTIQNADGGWGFQLETGAGAAEVRNVLDGSPLAMWNIACRSRGEEPLCVEAGDVLLDVAAMDTPLAMASQTFKLRRSRERQASIRAMQTTMVAAAKPKPTPELEEKRKNMLEAAGQCEAALPAALAKVFAAAPQPAATSLADCLRSLGSIEALEEDFSPIYNCVHCSTEKACRRFASKRAWLKPPLPPVVPVQLKRFYGQQGSYYKSKTKIKTSSVLDLSSVMLTEPEQQQLQPFMTPDSKLAASAGITHESAKYELYAVCAHLGGSMERGHYVAFVNTGPSLEKEAWFLLDDARATACQRQDALLVEAYIAFYRRPSPPEAPAEPKSLSPLDACPLCDG